MKRIMTSLFILSLVLLTACFGGKGDNAKEVTYDGQIAKLQKDIIEYQNSTKRAGEKEFKMYGEGIYVNILAEDNIEGYEGWYFYSLDVVVATEGDQMKELVKLVSVAGPKDNVHTVFGDNYVGLFEYKGIADTKSNGKAFETVLKEDTTIVEVTEDGNATKAAGDIVPSEDKKASVTSKLTYDVTKSAITFTYKDNLITEAAVKIANGEKVITTKAAITAKDGNATIADITLPGTIGVETVYTLSSKDIIFGDNNEITVAPKPKPVIEKAESVDTRTVKLTLKDAYTIEELTKQAITIKNTKEGSTEEDIELVVLSVKDKEVTVKTTTTAAVLVDAATYAVTSEFFVGEDITFVAKVADIVYTVVKQTRVAIAEQKYFYFGLENQYGEKVEYVHGTTEAPKVELKINGIVKEEVAPIGLEGFLKYELASDILKDDELEFTFKSADGNAYDEKSVIKYTVEAKPENYVAEKVTRSEDIKLTASAIEIAAGESIKFTAVGFDIYGAPVPLTAESNIIWTIDGTTISEAEGTLSDNTLEYTFNTPGTYEIRVSWEADTKINKTVTITVGDAKLSSITLTEISIDKDGKIAEGAYPTKIESKEGKIAVLKVAADEKAAPLALNELTITVKENDDKIVAADVNVTPELEKDGKFVIVSIAPTKVGTFKLDVKANRDDVEVNATSESITVTQVTTVSSIKLATKATDDVASVKVNSGNTLKLKKGNTLALEMVLFNKHGEEITEDKLVDADNFSILSKTHKVEASELVIANPVVHKTITSGAIINTISITTDTTKNAEFEVKFTKDDVEDYIFNVDAYLAKVTAIDAIGDITADKALVANDGVKYHVVKFLDQDGDAIVVNQNDAKTAVKATVKNKNGEEVAVNGTDAKGFKVTFSKGDTPTTAAVWLDKDTAAAEAGNGDPVTGINVAADVTAGEYTVTVEIADTNPAITKTFKVNVGETRKAKTITIEGDTVINLATGAKNEFKFVVKDQYGVAKDITPTDAKVYVGTTEVLDPAVSIAKDGEKTGTYTFTLTGASTLNGDVTVVYKEETDEKVTSNKIKVNNVAEAAIKTINVVAKTKIATKIGEDSAVTIGALDVINAAQNVALTAITFDKDGKEIKWADDKQPANLKWEVVEAKDADGGTMVTTGFSFTNSTELVTPLELKDLPNYTVKVKVSVTDGVDAPNTKVYASKEITLNVDNNENLLADKVVIGKVVIVDGSINALVVDKDGVKSIEVEAGKKFALELNSEDQFGNVKAIEMVKAEENTVAEAGKLVVKEIVKDKYIVSAVIDNTTKSLVIQTNGNYVGTSTLKVTFLDANGTEVEKTFSIKVLEKAYPYAKASTATVTNANDVSVVKNGTVALEVKAKDQFDKDIKTALKFVDAITEYDNGSENGIAAAVAAIGDNDFAVVVLPTNDKYTVEIVSGEIVIKGVDSVNEQEGKITILDKNGDTFELVVKVTVTQQP